MHLISLCAISLKDPKSSKITTSCGKLISVESKPNCVIERRGSELPTQRRQTILGSGAQCIGRDCLALPEQDRLYLEACEKHPSPSFLGMLLRNNCSLWKNDIPLVKWFNERGITHADDMSPIILTSIWRRVRGADLDLEGQIKSYQDYWIRNIGKPAP